MILKEIVPTISRATNLSNLMGASDKEVWLELSTLSLDCSRSTGRSLAPSRTIAYGALRDLGAAGYIRQPHLEHLGAQWPTAHAAEPACEEDWAALCAQIELRLEANFPTSLQLICYETIWKLLAAADIVQYAISLIRNGHLGLSLARRLVVALREVKTCASIEQQRFALWLACQHDETFAAAKGAETQKFVTTILYTVATEYRFSRAYAPPADRRLSAMELIFNARFARLGRAYFEVPASLQSLQEAWSMR